MPIDKDEENQLLDIPTGKCHGIPDDERCMEKSMLGTCPGIIDGICKSPYGENKPIPGAKQVVPIKG